MKYSEIKGWLRNPIVCDTLISQSKWFEVDGMLIYLRYGKAYIDQSIHDNIITIASASMIDEKNCSEGRFTSFLDFMENEFKINTLLIESVLNKRFREFFERRNYSKLDNNNYVLYGI